MGFWLWPFEVFELVGLMEKLRASLAQRLVQCASIDCQWETYLMGLNQLEWPSWLVKRLWIIAPPMPSKLYCHYSGATKHQHSATQSYPKMMYLLQRVDRLLFFLGWSPSTSKPTLSWKKTHLYSTPPLSSGSVTDLIEVSQRSCTTNPRSKSMENHQIIRHPNLPTPGVVWSLSELRG